MGEKSSFQKYVDIHFERYPKESEESKISRIRSLFDDCCTEWDSISDFISHPLADLFLIAEVFHYAPEFVMSHPRWQEIKSLSQWESMLARPKRSLPVSSKRVPIYYRDIFLAGKDGKRIAECLTFGGLIGSELFDVLVAKNNQSINAYYAELENRPEWLMHFAKSTYAGVRLRVAKNPFATPDVLKLLCLDKDQKVAQAAISHERFPAEAVSLVGEKEDKQINEKLDKLDSLNWKELTDFFLHPELPTEMLSVLANRNDPVILFACAMHPNAADSILYKALNQPENWLKAAVALNPCAPLEILNGLMAIEDFDIAFALASNPSLPEALQLKLAAHSDRLIRLHLADQTQHLSVWSEIAKHPGPNTNQAPFEGWLALAIDPKTPGKKLKAMHSVTNRSRSGGEVLASAISHAIAQHANFPMERLGEYRCYLPRIEKVNKAVSLMLLEGTLPEPEPYDDWKLSTAHIAGLPAHVANHLLITGDTKQKRLGCWHPHCNKALLIPLLFSTDINTIKKLAEKRDLPRFFYEILWSTGSETVRKILNANDDTNLRGVSFKNTKTAVTNLGIASTSDECVSVETKGDTQKVKGNKKARAELADNTNEYGIVEQLLKDKMVEVRAALADNPFVFQYEHIWRTLAGDSSEEVRRALASNNAITFDAITFLVNDCDPVVVEKLIYRLVDFSEQETLALEEKLYAMGGQIAKTLARFTKQESLQLKMAESHPEELLSNRWCTTCSVLKLLRRRLVDIDQIYRLVNRFQYNEKADEQEKYGVILSASKIAFAIVKCTPAEYDAVFLDVFPDADAEERIEFSERINAFRRVFERSDDAWNNVYINLILLLRMGWGVPAIQELFLGLFKFSGIPKNVQNYIDSLLLEVSPVFPPGFIEQLLSDPEEGRRALVAARSDLSDDVLEVLKNDQSSYVRRNLARSTPKLASHLVNDTSADVRYELAQSARELEVLKILASDSNLDVLRALAGNQYCSEEILQQLAHSKKNSIRSAVTYNNAASEPILLSLLDDTDPDIRRSVKSRLAASSLDATLHARLLKDREIDLISELLDNPNCNQEILLQLAEHTNARVREDAASNPNLADDILQKLLLDPVRRVREAAAYQIAQRRKKL